MAKKTKQQLEQLKELARMYYMEGDEQKEIALRVGVSVVTINRWVKDGGWQERRGGRAISRQELVKKILLSIDRKIEELSSTTDPTIYDTIVAQLTKLSASLEKLDKSTNIVTSMEVFRSFNEWMRSRMSQDDISPELLKTINKYQDQYINEKLNTVL